MFHIALCDDDARQRQIIRRQLDRYIASQNAVVYVREFSSGLDLLNAICDETFDIYLLDILMPNINGIDLGLMLRKYDDAGIIIYLTSSPDFALQGYHAKASAYLLKPISDEELFSVLDDTFKTLSNRYEKSFFVKNRNGTILLPLDDILYVEQINRIPHYYLQDGSSVFGVTMRTSYQETMQPLLEDARFHLCGTSYIFNLHHIKSITKAGVLFTGGRQVSVPKRSSADLHRSWIQYWLKGGNNHV